MAPRTALLLGLIAATGSAFAVQEPQPPAFTARRMALDMPSGGGGEVVPELKAPAALYHGAVEAGAAKASAPFSKIFNLGVVSGAHIGFGIWLAISVGGACPGIAADNPGLQKIIMGAFGLPFGLIMTLVTGGELFTGNTALVTAAYMEGKIEKKALAKSWVASYLGNFVGSLILAYLAFKSGTLGSAPGAVTVASTFPRLCFAILLCGCRASHLRACVYFCRMQPPNARHPGAWPLRVAFSATGSCAWPYTWHRDVPA